MPQDDSLPPTETYVAKPLSGGSALWQKISQPFKSRRSLSQLRQSLGLSAVGHVAVGTLAILAGVLTAENLLQVRFLERQAQTWFFNIRGPVQPPGNIVILAIDQESLAQARINQIDPTRNQNLDELSGWPFRRETYADVIERLMQAGAKSVAVDILWADPSVYGPADDTKLQQVLQRYPGRVTMAVSYETNQTHQGGLTQLTLPYQPLRSAATPLGSINFWTEPENFWKEPEGAEGRIHRFGSLFPILKAQATPVQASYFLQNSAQIPSFAEGALQAAQVKYAPPMGEMIYFYGPSRGGKGEEGFDQVPFWYVLDADNWKGYLRNGAFFKDKIVVIGTVADNGLEDYLATPFGKMPGVEVHASAIASLQEGKAIADAIPNLFLRGCLVALLILAAGYLQSRTSRPLRRFWVGIAIALAWGALSYGIFARGYRVLPTAIPMAAIGLTSASYLFAGMVSEKLRMRKVMKPLVSVPMIQKLITEAQDSDLQSLLEQDSQELLGKKLRGHYRINEELSSGGFGRTYIAQDLDRPKQPLCVVKRLRPVSNSLSVLQLAHRMFPQEAETLEKLGTHPQIPQLLAYFEENDEFYLVQEYVEGKSLADEMHMSRLLGRFAEWKVIKMVQEILEILEFVHAQGVIHRDIKPANIIRRKSDNRLVLIDFGAVKQIVHLEDNPEPTKLTVAIGTEGFMAPEQADGRPCPGSDIYSVGIIGIQALTGILASDLKDRRNRATGELDWQGQAQVSHALAEILNKMVRYNYTERYQTAGEALADLRSLPLSGYSQPDGDGPNLLGVEPPLLEDEPDDSSATETKLWPNTFSAGDLPPTDPPPPDRNQPGYSDSEASEVQE